MAHIPGAADLLAVLLTEPPPPRPADHVAGKYPRGPAVVWRLHVQVGAPVHKERRDVKVCVAALPPTPLPLPLPSGSRGSRPSWQAPPCAARPACSGILFWAGLIRSSRRPLSCSAAPPPPILGGPGSRRRLPPPPGCGTGTPADARMGHIIIIIAAAAAATTLGRSGRRAFRLPLLSTDCKPWDGARQPCNPSGHRAAEAPGGRRHRMAAPPRCPPRGVGGGGGGGGGVVTRPGEQPRRTSWIC